MARIAGIDLPNRRIEIALTYIYGIGRTSAQKILAKTGINPGKKAETLTDEDVARLRSVIENEFKVEGALRAEISQNIRRLVDIKCYRGLRHRKGLPVRGQRTRTNSRTRKGPRRKIGGKKKG